MRTSLGKYILDDQGQPVEVEDTLDWGRWYETANRHVAETTIGNVRISTVFLGMDHNWGEGPPVLWETMVFGSPLDGEQERYTSREEAAQGHEAMVERVKAALLQPS